VLAKVKEPPVVASVVKDKNKGVKGEWACARCTFVNKEFAHACEMCNNRKEEDEDEDEDEDESSSPHFSSDGRREKKRLVEGDSLPHPSTAASITSTVGSITSVTTSSSLGLSSSSSAGGDGPPVFSRNETGLEIEWTQGGGISCWDSQMGWQHGVLAVVKDDKVCIHVNGLKPRWLQRTSEHLAPYGTQQITMTPAYDAEANISFHHIGSGPGASITRSKRGEEKMRRGFIGPERPKYDGFDSQGVSHVPRIGYYENGGDWSEEELIQQAIEASLMEAEPSKIDVGVPVSLSHPKSIPASDLLIPISDSSSTSSPSESL